MKFQYNDSQDEPFQFQFSTDELGVIRFNLFNAMEKFQQDVKYFERDAKLHPEDDFKQKHTKSQQQSLNECETVVKDFESAIMHWVRRHDSNKKH